MKLLISLLLSILFVHNAFVDAATLLQMTMVEPTHCTGGWSVSPDSPYLCLAGPTVSDTEYEQDYIQFLGDRPDWTELPDNLVVEYTAPNHKVTASGNITVKFTIVNESTGSYTVTSSYPNNCAARVEDTEVTTVCDDSKSHVGLRVYSYLPKCSLTMAALVVVPPSSPFSKVELEFDIPAKAKEDWALGCSSSANTWEFVWVDYEGPPQTNAWSTEYPNYETMLVVEPDGDAPPPTTLQPTTEGGEQMSNAPVVPITKGSIMCYASLLLFWLHVALLAL